MKQISLPNLEFYYNKNATVLDIVLHGGSEGISSIFIQKIIAKARNTTHSVVAFNFPFIENQDTKSSGPDLLEEQEALKEVLYFINANKYKRIHLIAKSLGAIVAGKFMKLNSDAFSNIFQITVLGYVKADIDLNSFKGKIHVIQGQKDRFGNIAIIKEDLKDAISSDITFTEIQNADHSYKDPITREPLYEDAAIDKIIF